MVGKHPTTRISEVLHSAAPTFPNGGIANVRPVLHPTGSLSERTNQERDRSNHSQSLQKPVTAHPFFENVVP